MPSANTNNCSTKTQAIRTGGAVKTHTTVQHRAPWAALAQKEVQKEDCFLLSEHDENSSQGFSEEEMSLSHYSESAEVPSTSLSQLSGPLLAAVASYLPLQTLNEFRAVSHSCQQAANEVASVPFTGAAFLKFNKDTNRGEGFEQQQLNRGFLRWTCPTCCANNTVGVHSCRQCGSTSTKSAGIRRVFLGQLRKERTVELAEWLIAMLYPDMELFHIENHTSANQGRGKGCAWVYVTNTYDEERLLSLNKRAFVDLDSQRHEGVWVVNEAGIDRLATIASQHAYAHGRPQVLPRQPIVCERPQVDNAGTKGPQKFSNNNAGNKKNMGARATLASFHTQHEKPACPVVSVRRNDPYAVRVIPRQFSELSRFYCC